METILGIAMSVTLATALVIAIGWRNVSFIGDVPSGLFTFIAVLFTSGLDVGLIMFPLTEFPMLASEQTYRFASPLAVEFGFWGFLVWVFYFLTTFYFCVVEPRVKLFRIPAIRFTNNLVVIGTCAFTGFLFLSYLPSYITGISEPLRYALVAVVVLCAVYSSTDIRYVKWLSVGSMWLFFALILVMWLNSGMPVGNFLSLLGEIGGYFTNLDKFMLPLSDHHAFYLFWWFAWSIMIGQFVSRFVGGMTTWQLLLALLVIPSIPIAVWFSVLYYYFTSQLPITPLYNAAMVLVGIVFVINSLDSLIRLYSDETTLTVTRFGRARYMLLHFALMYSLILAYQFTPMKIQWVGLVVIGIYTAIYVLLYRHHRAGRLSTAVEG